MGIPHLNKYIKQNCNDCLFRISLSELSGKSIVIDTSIYMYKFESDGTLIENFYLMVSIFRHYNIIPIFIFDGKPPAEKKALLEQRRVEKNNAEKEYKMLQKQLCNDSELDINEKQEIISTMDQLKKRFTVITREKIDKVKDLLKYYGATYFDSYGESDILCAALVMKKKSICMFK